MYSVHNCNLQRITHNAFGFVDKESNTITEKCYYITGKIRFYTVCYICNKFKCIYWNINFRITHF